MTPKERAKRYTTAERERIVRQHMEKHDGVCDPGVFVKAAKRKNHPAHDYFEWTDSKAAHAYRLQQARQFIKVNVEIAEPVEVGPIVVKTQPLLVSPPETRKEVSGGRYVYRSSEYGRKALREEAVKRMRQWIERYATVLTDEEVATISAAAETLLGGKQEAAKAA